MEAINLCGKRLKIARIEKGMKQVEVSAALSVECKVELSQKSLSRIEVGKRSVTDIELVALAKVLEVTIDWLVYGNKPTRH